MITSDGQVMAERVPPKEYGHGYNVIPSNTAKQGLHCPECEYILRLAVQTPDGIRLCEPCYKRLASLPKYTSPKTDICVAGDDGEPSCYPDKAVRREVMQLEIFCENKQFGCPWCNALSYYEAHLKDCQFVPAKCTNEGCDKLVPLDSLKHHLEHECDFGEISCDYCGELTIRMKLDEHYASCAKFPVSCEQCGIKVCRDELDSHNIKDCETVRCSCEALLKRNAPAKEKNSVHSHLAKPAEVLFHILSIGSLLNKVIKSNTNIDQRLKAIEDGGVKQSKSALREESAKYRAEIQQNFRAITDRLLPLEQYQTELQLSFRDKNMASKISDLQKKLNQMESKNTQQGIQIQSLQTQIQKRAVTSSLATPSEQFGSTDGSRLMTVEKRYEELEKQVSMLKVHVSELELQLQASLASTHNGSFLWRIPDIPRRKRDAVEERITSIYSPPFYTGRNGYKMCIRAYLNGDGMGYKTHLSLFFVVMKGEFDALLKWPFDYKVSLILVDQNHRKHIVQTFKPTAESNSFQRPVSDMNVASGCPQFAKLSVLDDDAYVKDDVLFVKCIVDTTRIFHP